MKTYIPKTDEIDRKWHLVDADGQTVGRLAATVANILRGKNKPTYTPHLDCGDYVIVINAEKVRLTGRKETGKEYQDYSGYMGGLKRQPAWMVREKNPTRMVREAVWGMLPKGRLGRSQFKKLKVYSGSDHPHAAQKPQVLEI